MNVRVSISTPEIHEMHNLYIVHTVRTAIFLLGYGVWSMELGVWNMEYSVHTMMGLFHRLFLGGRLVGLIARSRLLCGSAFAEAAACQAPDCQGTAVLPGQ